MSFEAIEIKGQQLPKMKAFVQLSGLGECAWYSPWDCYESSDVQAAKDELEAAHVVLLDFVNGTRVFYDDAVANSAPSSITDPLYRDVQNGHSLVQQHSNLMSTFYAETGSGVAGLRSSNARLGVLVLGWTLIELATFMGLAIKAVSIGYLVIKLGEVIREAALAFQQSFKSSQEKFKRDAQFYIAWKGAKEKGIEPPPSPDELDEGTTDWTTVALIGGSTVLAIIILTSKRR